jgi:prepilin-type N-terminal cleavage/methylation domain-containing protein
MVSFVVDHRRPGKPRGFTLIELLVVVTIIVVLLALLSPALDRAIYVASLATCAAQQDSMVTGLQSYAMDHKRYYPDKPGARQGSDVWWTMDQLFVPSGTGRTGGQTLRPFDHRITVAEYINHKFFVDPLAGNVSLAVEDTDDDGVVLASYFLLDGFQYRTGPNQGPLAEGMIKMGNRLRWFNSTQRYTFNVLVSDKLHYFRAGDYTIASHPDTTLGKGQLSERQNGPALAVGPVQRDKYTYTHYNFFKINDAEGAHGLLDLNYGMQDGSVRQVGDIEPANFNDPSQPGDHPLRGVPFITEGGSPNGFFEPSNWLLEGH